MDGYRRGGSLVLLALGACLPTVQATAGDCLVAPTVWHDSTSSCDVNRPTVRRMVGSEVLRWRGTEYVVANSGNELRFHVADGGPLGPPVSSTELCGQFPGDTTFPCAAGDQDYNLLSVAVCDDCRFAAATYSTGTALLDLGTGDRPFAGDARITSGTARGAVTFTWDRQYLLTNDLASGCGTTAALYRFDSVAPTATACLTAGGAPLQVASGTRIGNFLYVVDTSRDVHVYRIDDARLVYLGSPLRSFRIAVDGPFLLAATISSLELWDVSAPASPVLLDQDPRWTTAVAAGGGLGWAAFAGDRGSERLYDLSRGGLDVVDAGWWDPAAVHNHPGNALCVASWGASFAGGYLHLMRFAIGQSVGLGDCLQTPLPLVFADGFECGSDAGWG